MSDTVCPHDLAPGTCSICRNGPSVTLTQGDLNPSAIAAAIDVLAPSSGDEFRTKDLAAHPIVMAAHSAAAAHRQFAQHVGIYLSEAWGLLCIEQVSPKG